MKLKSVATTCVVAALAMGPARPVLADAGDAIAGAIVGGILGHAIAKDQQRRSTTTAPRTTTRSTMSAAQREANREVQVALNHFGFPVGTPDGAIGPKSRGAISSYQALLGYPPTGQLTEYERTLLVTAYHRAVAGGPMVAQVVGTHPMGMKGLLIVQRDEMAGLPTAMPTAPANPFAAQTAVEPAPEPAPALPALVAEPEPAAPALPSFMGGTTVSLASHCNKVSLTTNANGGYVTAASMADPMQALSEQFCLTRSLAIAQGEEMAAKVAGFTPDQIADQCKAFGPVLKDHVVAVSLKPAPEVLGGVADFVAGSGMSPAQLAGTAKVCLGVGYGRDDMEVAVGAALMLTALGEAGYAELLGHHLAQGIGATMRPDLAMGWYEMSLGAMGQGAGVLVPATAERGELIRKAAFAINGRSEAPSPAAPLPVFAAPEAEVVEAPQAVPEAAPVMVEAEPEPQMQEPMVTMAADPSGGAPISAAKAVGIAARLPMLLLGQ